MAIPAVFQNRRDVSREVKSLLKAIEHLGRGEIVTYELILDTTKMEREDKNGKPTKGWKSLINQVRAALELRGFILGRAIPLSGYPILDPPTQRAAATKIRKARNRLLGKNALYLGLLPDDAFNEEERMTIFAELGQLTEEKQLIDRHKKERHLWLTQKETLPRLPSA